MVDQAVNIVANLRDNITSRLGAINRNIARMSESFKDLNKFSSDFKPNVNRSSLSSFSQLTSRISQAISEFDRLTGKVSQPIKAPPIQPPTGQGSGSSRETKNYAPIGAAVGAAASAASRFSGGGGGSRPFIGGQKGKPWVYLVTESVPPISWDLDVVIAGWARNFVETALGYVKKAVFLPFQYLQKHLPERIQDEMSDVKAAGGIFSISNRMKEPILKSFAEAESLARETNRFLSELAGSLPGSTEEYVQVAKQIQDGIMQVLANDTENSVKLAKEIAEANGRLISEESRSEMLKNTATELVGEMTKLTVLAGLGGSATGPYGLPVLVERMLSEEKVSMGMFQRYAAIFREPMIRTALERNIDKINETAMNTADRYKALIDTFEQIVTPELVRRYRRTISGNMEAIRTSLFSPEVGLFGLGRPVEVADNINYQYDSFGRRMTDEAGWLTEQALSIFDYLRDIFFNVVWSLLPIIENFKYLFDPLANLIPGLTEIRDSTMYFQRSFEQYYKYTQDLSQEMLDFVKPFDKELSRLDDIREKILNSIREMGIYGRPDTWRVYEEITEDGFSHSVVVTEGVTPTPVSLVHNDFLLSQMKDLELISKSREKVAEQYEEDLRKLGEGYTWLGKWLRKYDHLEGEEIINLLEKDLVKFRATSGLRASLNNISMFLYNAGDITGDEFLYIAELLESPDFTNFGPLMKELANRFLSGNWAEAVGEAIGSIIGTAITTICDILKGTDEIISGSTLLKGFKAGFTEAGGKDAFWCIVRNVFDLMIKGVVMLFQNLWWEITQLFFLFNIFPSLVQGVVRRGIQGIIHGGFSMFRGGGGGGNQSPIRNQAPPPQAPSMILNHKGRPIVPTPSTPPVAPRVWTRPFNNFGSSVGTFAKSIGKWNIITSVLFGIIDAVTRIMSGQDVGSAIGAAIVTSVFALLGTVLGALLGGWGAIPLGIAGSLLGSAVADAIFPRTVQGTEGGQALPGQALSDALGYSAVPQGMSPEFLAQQYKSEQFDEQIEKTLNPQGPLWQRILQGVSDGFFWLAGSIVGLFIVGGSLLGKIDQGIREGLWAISTFFVNILTNSEFRLNISNAISEWLYSVRYQFLSGLASVIGEDRVKAWFPDHGYGPNSYQAELQTVRREINIANSTIESNPFNSEMKKRQEQRLITLRRREQNLQTLIDNENSEANYKGSFGTDNFMTLPRAIQTELKHKPPGSNLVIANSSELIIPTKAAANGNGDITVLTAPLNHIASTNTNALQYLNNILQKNHETKNEISQLKVDNANRLNVVASLTNAVGSILQSGIKVEVTNTPTVKMSFDFGEGTMGPIGGGIGNFPMTSPYGNRGGRLHAGNDYGMPVGTKLALGIPGQVLRAGWMGGYGMNMDIMGADGVMYRFAHLSSFLLPPGASVVPNVPFALSGNTGRSTGPHLHFEAHPGGRGAVNPTPFAGVIRANYAGMDTSQVMGAIGGELANMPYGSDLVVGNSSEIMMKPNQAANLVSSSVRAGMQGSGSVNVSGITINVNGANKSGRELAEEIASHIMDAIESANYSGVYG